MLSPARRPSSILAAIVFAVLALGGCQATVSDKNLDFVDPSGGESIVNGRKKLLGIGDEGRGAWVDPRTEREFVAGHIPGALHVPFENVAAHLPRLRRYEALVVYGNDYNSPVAKAMSKHLIENGLRNVHTLKGGLRAWKNEERPLAEGEEQVIPPASP